MPPLGRAARAGDEGPMVVGAVPSAFSRLMDSSWRRPCPADRPPPPSRNQGLGHAPAGETNSRWPALLAEDGDEDLPGVGRGAVLPQVQPLPGAQLQAPVAEGGIVRLVWVNTLRAWAAMSSG